MKADLSDRARIDDQGFGNGLATPKNTTSERFHTASANSRQQNSHFQAQTILNCTELIFCRDTVDPDFVTHTLELQPTHSYKVGDVVAVGDIQRPSYVGMWKLRLPDSQADETVEEQLARWLTMLGTKRERMGRLRQLGYSPYLDCRAEKGSLSLCIEPVVLAGLGMLGIALSVWLPEAPAAKSTPVSDR